MAGKPQKPTDQLQFRRGGRAERRTLAVEAPGGAPATAPAAPKAPKGLEQLGRRVWKAYWADPVSRAASGVDLYDVERYCRLLDQRAAWEAQLIAQPTVTNEYGEQPHPLFKLVKELTREIEKLREQLGILPLARMRLGLVTTQQKATAADLRAKLRREATAPARPAAPIEAQVIDLTEGG